MNALQIVSEKINTLPPDKIAEVIDFIDFLARKEKSRHDTERFEMISQYARENAGGEFDLNSELEQAGLENLLTVDEGDR